MDRGLEPIGAGCHGLVLRSGATPVDAVAALVAQSHIAEFGDGQETPVQEVLVEGRSAAVQVAVMPADGPIIYVAAVETEAGSDLIICSQLV